ncbi:hypothetical protein FZEAL_589 [Fusarium zealandicum]|uniref:C2H2 type master regulator of conidiophore development brlA n=1 Tax=Fusarium zealandicum TaxID=1053134 RepID=A0A8H4XQS6_9HYPO|nr:hypothetical protein FZEAL_589 [Fusarium zealandicum]
MDHSASFGHQPASFEPVADKVDYGFDSLLGHDACLTHGLDSLGTCNNNENACLDQRCFDHYGKTSAAAKTALDIGTDSNAEYDALLPHLSSKPIASSRVSKVKTRSHSLTAASKTIPCGSSKTQIQRQNQRQKRKRQSDPIQQTQEFHQPHHMHQMHSSQMFHHAQHQPQMEPMPTLQSLNQPLHHNCFHSPLLENSQDTHPALNDFQHHTHAFSMPASPHGCWPQSVPPSWAAMMSQPIAENCMSMSWTDHMACGDAASAACNSACDDAKCAWDHCEVPEDADCCFDDSCLSINYSHAACCWEPACAVPEPCLDTSCQEASIPCTDAHCMGTTVSTTPASVSVTTPSAEPEPIVDAILSPGEHGQGLSLDFDHTIGHGLVNFSHGFTHDLDSDLSQQHNHPLGHNHAGHQDHRGDFFGMASHRHTPKAEQIDTESMVENTDFKCHWLCETGTLCLQTFENNKDLQDHCKIEHVKSLKKGPNGFCCTWYACIRPGPFSQKSKLERHMQTHTGYKPVKCEICGIMLSAKQSLEQHMRTHSGEKPWECKFPGCTQRFKQQSALTMHMRTHTGEKPLECEICGKRFGESSNLSKHRRTHNVRGNHVCEVCGKDFHRLDQLRRHLPTHDLEGGRKSKGSG